MAKKRKKKADHPRRPTIVRRDVPRRDDAGAQPLIQSLRRCLYADHPVDLLLTVSGIAASTERRPGLGPDDGPGVELSEIVESFEGVGLAATTAALHVLAALTPDELLAARIRRSLAVRHQPMPRWLSALADSEVVDVWEMRHVQRDGEDYFLDVRLPDGFALTALVYVDNNLGGVVKDAFVIPERFAAVREKTEALADPDTTWTSMDPADVRVLLERAIEHGSIVFPPLETDTWPLCRPLVRWLLRRLPEGGQAPEWSAPSEVEQAELTETFFASPRGSSYDDAEHRSLFEDLLWFGYSQGTGDPLRWSPVNVEILLTDWYPRKVVAEADLLTKLPDLLRAFIRFSHEQAGLRRDLTRETLAAVDRWEPEYQRVIRTDRPQGAEALARMLLDHENDRSGRWGMDPLVDVVGGRTVLDALTDEPLPDEEFDWHGVPDDIRDKVAEIVGLCDRNADEFLDMEHRTANRRLLRRVVEVDPAFFRGKAAARTSAAAICWMVAQANDSISAYGPLTAGELLEPFGVRSASQRAAHFRSVLGLPEPSPGEPMSLGSADLLVSDRRRELIDERDMFHPGG